MSNQPTAGSVPVPRTDEIFGEQSTTTAPETFDREHTKRYLRDLHGYDEELLETKSNDWLFQCLQDHRDQPNRFYRVKQ